MGAIKWGDQKLCRPLKRVTVLIFAYTIFTGQYAVCKGQTNKNRDHHNKAYSFHENYVYIIHCLIYDGIIMSFHAFFSANKLELNVHLEEI